MSIKITVLLGLLTGFIMSFFLVRSNVTLNTPLQIGFFIFFGLIFSFVNFITIGAITAFLMGSIEGIVSKNWKWFLFGLIGTVFCMYGYCSMFRG